MSDLTAIEKRRFERLLGLSSGYVLDFSNSTFAEFVGDSTGQDIYADRYDYGSGSKANRLRGFWIVAPNHQVAQLLSDLLDHGQDIRAFETDPPELIQACRAAIERLRKVQPVTDIDALAADPEERDFDAFAKQIRDAIDRHQPAAALDRLHTYVVRFVRSLCERRGITVSREKPLHSIFGEYVKRLREGGLLESEMTVRILKSSISVLEAFNDVRNSQSLAHDNQVLNDDESLLIFNYVASSIRFIRSLEDRLQKAAPPVAAAASYEDDLPF